MVAAIMFHCWLDITAFVTMLGKVTFIVGHHKNEEFGYWRFYRGPIEGAFYIDFIGHAGVHLLLAEKVED